MTRTTILSATGAVALAAVLTGVGWTAASGDGPAPTEQPVAEAQKPAKLTPPTAKEVAQPDEGRRNQDAIERLEKMAAQLRNELELREKVIELNTARGPRAADALAPLHKRHTELEQAVFAAERELTQFEAEATVLKRRIEAKADPASKEYLAQAVEDEAEVRAAAREVALARQLVDRAKAIAANPNAPAIGELETKAAAAAKALEDVREGYRRKLTPEVVKRLLDERNKPHRERLVALELKVEIKREELAALSKGRDALSAKIEASTDAGLRVAELRREAEPLREMLARVQRELLLHKAKQSGVTLTEPAGSDAKLDAILRELAVLRKEVGELRQKK